MIKKGIFLNKASPLRLNIRLFKVFIDVLDLIFYNTFNKMVYAIAQAYSFQTVY